LLTNISFIPAFIYPDSGQLSYCTCNHNWQHYNQNCYTRYGIQQPKELAKATAKRHCEFIAGRYCASQAIKNLAQPPNSTSETQILIQPDRSPLWPQSIVGSISHSGKRAVAVAGNAQRYSGLGIDCESLLTESLAAEITDLVLHPLDRGLLLNRPSQQELNRGFLVTLAFSAKESLFKALSPSFTNIKGFHDFSIRHISGEELILSPTKKLSSSLSTATEFRVSYVKQADFIVTRAIITVKN
jgi:enterobactin synthetase component D